AIAAAVLLSSKQLTDERIVNTLIVGELALNGQIRAVYGLIAMLEYAKRCGITHIILPKDNVEEAFLISDLHIAPIAHLSELKELHFTSTNSIPPSGRGSTSNERYHSFDIAYVIGQLAAKRALLI